MSDYGGRRPARQPQYNDDYDRRGGGRDPRRGGRDENGYGGQGGVARQATGGGSGRPRRRASIGRESRPEPDDPNRRSHSSDDAPRGGGPAPGPRRAGRRMSIGRGENPGAPGGRGAPDQRGVNRTKSGEGQAAGGAPGGGRQRVRRASITAIASGAAVEGFPGMSTMNSAPQQEEDLGYGAPPQQEAPQQNARVNRHGRRPGRRMSLTNRETPLGGGGGGGGQQDYTPSSALGYGDDSGGKDRLDRQKGLMEMLSKKAEEPKPETPAFDDLGYGNEPAFPEPVEEPPPQEQAPPGGNRRRRNSLIGNIGLSKFSAMDDDDHDGGGGGGGGNRGRRGGQQPRRERSPPGRKKSSDLSDMMQKTSIQGRGHIGGDRDRQQGSLLDRVGRDSGARSGGGRRKAQERGGGGGGSTYSDRIMSKGRS